MPMEASQSRALSVHKTALVVLERRIPSMGLLDTITSVEPPDTTTSTRPHPKTPSISEPNITQEDLTEAATTTSPTAADPAQKTGQNTALTSPTARHGFSCVQS
jgi:hypothetical protein